MAPTNTDSAHSLTHSLLFLLPGRKKSVKNSYHWILSKSGTAALLQGKWDRYEFQKKIELFTTFLLIDFEWNRIPQDIEEIW